MDLPDIQPAGRTRIPGIRSSSAIAGFAAASAFESIARGAADLRQQLQPAANAQAAEKGAEDAKKAFDEREGDELPEVVRRTVWSQQDAVYNNSLEAGTMARASIDLENETAVLRSKFQYDPDGYREASRKFLDAYMGGNKNLPVTLGQQIELTAERQFARDLSSITANTRARQVAEDQESLQLRLQQIQAEMNTGIAQGTDYLQTDEFRQLQADAVNIVNTLVDNPAYGWSAERGAQELDSLANSGQESLLYSMVDSEFLRAGESGAVGFIEEQIAGMTLNNAERIGLRSRLMQRVNMAQSIQNEQLKRQNLFRQQLERQQERDAQIWEAEALRRRINDEPLDDEFIRAGLLHVANGGATAARIESQLAIPDPTEVVTDQASLALAYDLARTGVDRDALEDATMDLVLQRQMTASQRESVLNEFDQFNDDTVKPGMDTIKAYFSQSPFDFNRNLAVIEDDAKRDLLDWREANPDATRSQLQDKALSLSIAYGRQVQPPSVPGLRNPPAATATPEQFNDWREAEEDRLVDADLGDEELQALFRQMDRYNQWWEYQNTLQRAARNNGEE